MSSETVKTSLLNSMNAGNVQFFNAEIKRIGLHQIEDYNVCDVSEDCDENSKKFTLMQYAAKKGLADMILALLNFGVDPNAVAEFNDQSPVLLAAEFGHYHVLQIFKDCSLNRNSKKPHQRFHRLLTATNLAFENNGMDMSEISVKSSTDFRVVKKASEETVLHLVLKRTVLTKHILDYKKKRHMKSLKNLKGEDRKRLLELDKNYLRCAHVLLEEDFMHEMDIVNWKDSLGNTPIHYATSNNWPQQIVKKLLYVGANITTTNQSNVMPLTRIPRETLKDFMDNDCITVDDFDDEIDEMDMDSDRKEGEDQDNLDLLHQYDPSFLTNTAELPVQFNYRFLVPEFDHKYMVQGRTPNDVSCPLVPEMSVLHQIATSKEHYRLVTHPVIKSYVWLKWKIISKLFHRNLRLRCYYVYILTWFIMLQYGGHQWRKNECFEESIERKMKNDSLDFCDNSTESNIQSETDVNHRFCADPEFYFNYKEGYHLPCIHKNPIYVAYVLLSIILGLGALGAFKDDLMRKLTDREGFFKMNQKMVMLLIACWLDFWTFVLLGLVLWKSEVILWFVITVILILTLTRELHQLLAMRLKYLKQLEKWFDFLHFGLVLIILFLPNKYMLDPLTFSSPTNLKKLCNAGVRNIEDWNKDNCSIKRVLAAFTIVFAWSRLLITMVKHPYLQRYNVYLQMLRKVCFSFMKFLFWYSFFIISFVLGFYIMMHNDVGNTKASLNPISSPPKGLEVDDVFKEFNHPIEAAIKTMAMYVGELDLSEMPLGVSKGMKHGNVTVTLIHVFILAFIFFIVMVLGNLLNGLAVSDTSEILRKAETLHQISLINNLTYGESVIMGNLRDFKKIAETCSILGNFLRRTIISAISSMLLLHSYIEIIPDRFPQLEVLIPLKRTEEDDATKRKVKTKCCVRIFHKISNAYNYMMRSILFSDEALNYGCDQFLNEAREILKAKRLAKVKARKKAEAKRKENELLRSLIHDELQKTNLLDNIKEAITNDRKLI